MDRKRQAELFGYYDTDALIDRLEAEDAKRRRLK